MPLPDESFWVDERQPHRREHRPSQRSVGPGDRGPDGWAATASPATRSTRARRPRSSSCSRAQGSTRTRVAGGSMAPWITIGSRLLEDVPLPDYRDVPAPPPQEPMPGDAAAAPPNPAIPEIDVPGTYRIRPVTAIAPAGGPEVEKELDPDGDADRIVVVEPAARSLRVPLAVRAVRVVGGGGAVGSDPAGVGADVASCPVDARRARGPVRSVRCCTSGSGGRRSRGSSGWCSRPAAWSSTSRSWRCRRCSAAEPPSRVLELDADPLVAPSPSTPSSRP